jgi:predicted nucleic acid-binding Zn ribbon protein
MEVTSSNPLLPLCEHVKKKKRKEMWSFYSTYFYAEILVMVVLMLTSR